MPWAWILIIFSPKQYDTKAGNSKYKSSAFYHFCFYSQSLEYWLWKILNMFGFVWVFTFYIEFVGEIFPFIFKLGAQTTAFCKDQRLGGTKNRFAFLTLVLAKANLSPHKFFIPPPPSYLMAHSYISQVSPLPLPVSSPLVLWGVWVFTTLVFHFLSDRKIHQKMQSIGRLLYIMW